MLVAVTAGLAVWHQTAPAPAPARLAAAATAPALARLPALARVARAPAPAWPATTALATVRFTSPRYAAPGVRAAGQVPSTWLGVPSVLPVVARRHGWVEVRLAQRPNGSTAWLPASDVRLTTTTYRIVINLATTRLTLYSGTRPLMSAPVGVGTAGDPTPAGHYFVAFDEPPP
jgi:L,D-transpeptidase catalytic domain